MIFVIDDDREWLDYYARLLGNDYDLEFFRDGVSAIANMDGVAPDLIILDVLLTGPTGFTLLNEMQSYEDLQKVPVIIVSSVDIAEDLNEYGVKKVLNKGEMKPKDVIEAVQQWKT